MKALERVEVALIKRPTNKLQPLSECLDDRARVAAVECRIGFKPVQVRIPELHFHIGNIPQLAEPVKSCITLCVKMYV